MKELGRSLAAAAEDQIGSRFKLGGRRAGIGLDCVGLVSVSFEAIGRPIATPMGYQLRHLSFECFEKFVANAGLVDVTGRELAGDVLLVVPATGQFHVGIIGLGQNLVHAHIGLRRVVSSPLPIQYPVVRHWRLET